MADERAPLLPDNLQDEDDNSHGTKSKRGLALLALFFILLCGGILGGATYALDRSWQPNYSNRVILIRHGEKPKHGKPGLSKIGRQRAECLRTVFAKKSSHNIGLILAQNFDEDSSTRARPFLTVESLASDLGLTVDVSCSRDDIKCVKRAVHTFAKTSSKDVLICWKHSLLNSIAQNLGSPAVAPYPDDRFDLMWLMVNQTIVSRDGEHCKGIDDLSSLSDDLVELE